jgi:hypothetical protein
MSEFCNAWHNITLEGAKRVRDHALLKASESGVSVSVVIVTEVGSYCLWKPQTPHHPGRPKPPS